MTAPSPTQLRGAVDVLALLLAVLAGAVVVRSVVMAVGFIGDGSWVGAVFHVTAVVGGALAAIGFGLSIRVRIEIDDASVSRTGWGFSSWRIRRDDVESVAVRPAGRHARLVVTPRRDTAVAGVEVMRSAAAWPSLRGATSRLPVLRSTPPRARVATVPAEHADAPRARLRGHGFPVD